MNYSALIEVGDFNFML